MNNKTKYQGLTILTVVALFVVCFFLLKQSKNNNVLEEEVKEERKEGVNFIQHLSDNKTIIGFGEEKITYNAKSNCIPDVPAGGTMWVLVREHYDKKYPHREPRVELEIHVLQDGTHMHKPPPWIAE